MAQTIDAFKLNYEDHHRCNYKRSMVVIIKNEIKNTMTCCFIDDTKIIKEINFCPFKLEKNN